MKEERYKKGDSVIKNDITLCGSYCIMFLHRIINENETFKEATDFNKLSEEE